MEGSLLAQLPVLASDRGLTTSDTALLQGLMGVGGVLFQFPLGWWADRRGVAQAARWAGAGAGAITVFAWAWGLGLGGEATSVGAAWALGALAVVIGGVSPGLLTLGLTHATRDPHGPALTARVREVSLVYTLASGAGPLAAGFWIDTSDSSMALVWQQAVVVAVLGGVLFAHAKGTMAWAGKGI
jgi:MFS family permease